MLLALAQWVQSTALSVALAGSTWAYPVIGALHVLGIAWFGGAVLLSALSRGDLNRRDPNRTNKAASPRPVFLWTGAALMLLTGALLLVIEPVRCAASRSFLVKMVLLIALVAIGRMRSKAVGPLILAFWAGVLLASRGIAFF